MRWAIVVGCCMVSLAAGAETLMLKGSNTLGEKLGPALAEAFLLQRGCTSVSKKTIELDHVVLTGDAACDQLTVDIEARGTSTGFAALSEKTADLAMASRPVNAAELRTLPALQDVTLEQVVALDGLAIIVAPGNPMRSLTLQQVQQIFNGEINSLAAVGGPSGPLNRYARDDRSGTFDTFKSLVLGTTPLSSTNTLRYESSNQLADAVARDPNGIGFVTLAAIGSAKALAISSGKTAAVAPSDFSIATEDYLLSRRLYFYHLPDTTKLARDFVAFTRTDKATQLVDAAHFISLNVRQKVPQLPAGSPDEYLELTRGLARLSLNFRFADGMSLLDSKSLADLDRLARFLKSQAQKPPVVLIGFSDAVESAPYLSMVLSTDRADYVAQRLGVTGVIVNKARGLGAVAPLANNDTLLGRQKNRRVEVWIGSSNVPAAAGSAP